MSRMASQTVLILGSLLVAPAGAQTLQESLDDLEVASRWAYNDWESARAAASISHKPIMALFR